MANVFRLMFCKKTAYRADISRSVLKRIEKADVKLVAGAGFEPTTFGL